MKIICYDCFSGISGDMNLGAMIDLGVDKDYLIGELNKLNLKGWELIVQKDQRHGIYGTRATVKQTKHEHAHRHLSDIKEIIYNSTLDDKTKELSLKIFMKIAEAEAAVHAISIERVHFHEVGAIDSIVDIVGAAICFNALKADAVHVAPVELGGGFVRCDHGMLPVPAPATAEIIKGLPVKKGGVDFEATTPTGAAIVSALGTHFGTDTVITIGKTGYGVGQKEHPDVPNLLRVSLGELESSSETGHDALQIECNIDDMNPEFFDHISDNLFKAGASDVFLSNIIMKKGRPGIVLNVICENETSEQVKSIIFAESTSLGIRSFPFRKDTLSRKFETISTGFGDVNIKRSFYKGKEVSVKPEFDDCRRIATEKGIPVKEVYNKIMALLVNM
ncbi:MAG: TIGR00299 family protein [Bacteroidetes bacterium GWE2_41_25]|nr:MAG: TIGR00299 family protein [Bacteroidetes bacterium GWA2_40_15]OFX94819.1 MAG: TIGR00299 family protein [Bacteroidetes bacterium GWC2_40_22]OFY00472.1 MAG: TIGR00299 family protein [Bacteroidetes bacterium GWE2_41_25]OFY60923.1 MAG: TIGR00299 family protein [Bacteroidetes bacterium GWF2_41_9]HAM10012.1 nickel pincer cofactor biosynthesis protein LarC [Bacteroidales bacterium]